MREPESPDMQDIKHVVTFVEVVDMGAEVVEVSDPWCDQCREK